MKKILPILGLVLYIVPVISLAGLGLYWLVEKNFLLYFIPFFLITSLAGYFIFKYASKRKMKVLSDFEPDVPEWSSSKDESAWDIVRHYQENIGKKEYDPEKPEDYLRISRNLLRDLSSHYNPERENPELEVSLPHLLHAISKTIDDVNHLVKRIPASHLITINSIRRTHKSYKTVMKYYDWVQYFYLFLRPK